MSLNINKYLQKDELIQGSLDCSSLMKNLRGVVCPTDIFTQLFPVTNTNTLRKGEIVVVERSNKTFCFTGTTNVHSKNVFKIPEKLIERLLREVASYVFENEKGVLSYSVLNRRTPPFSSGDTIKYDIETGKIDSSYGDMHYFANNTIVKTATILRQAAYVYDERSRKFSFVEVDPRKAGKENVFAELIDGNGWMIQQQSRHGCSAAAVAMIIADNKDLQAISVDDLKNAQFGGRLSIIHKLDESGFRVIEHTPRNIEEASYFLRKYGSAIVCVDYDHFIVLNSIDPQTKHFQIREPYHGIAMTVIENKQLLDRWIQVKK